MKMSRPACPVPQLGRDVDVQMKVPGEASSVCQFAMKSESWNGSDSPFSLSPRTVE
jgi:hypothetical protein